MAVRFLAFMAGVCFLGSLEGCIQPITPSDPPPPPTTVQQRLAPPPLPTTKEALIERWMVLAKTPLESQITMQPSQIAAKLAPFGPDALTPIIDVLKDPTSDPRKKLLVVQSLGDYITSDYLGQLTALVDEEKDGTTRSCATMLIALIRDQDVSPTLEHYMKDEEGRVRLAAMIGLANMGDEAVRDQLMELYWSEESSDKDKLAIVRMTLQKGPRASDFKMLSDALLAADTDSYTRNSITVLMGREGDGSVLDALETSREKYPDPAFKRMAEAAISSIEKRESISKDEKL